MDDRQPRLIIIAASATAVIDDERFLAIRFKRHHVTACQVFPGDCRLARRIERFIADRQIDEEISRWSGRVPYQYGAIHPAVMVDVERDLTMLLEHRDLALALQDGFVFGARANRSHRKDDSEMQRRTLESQLH